jgi:hypothetical protein
MSLTGCREIVNKRWPDSLAAWLRVEEKLDAMRNEVVSGSTTIKLGLEFDPEEREVLSKLFNYLVKDYEMSHGSLAYIVERFAPSAALMLLKEVYEKLS